MDFALPPAIVELKRRARRFVDEECIPLERELEPDWIELRFASALGGSHSNRRRRV